MGDGEEVSFLCTSQRKLSSHLVRKWGRGMESSAQGGHFWFLRKGRRYFLLWSCTGNLKEGVVREGHSREGHSKGGAW